MKPHSPIQNETLPILDSDRVLGQPIRRLLATHDRTEGAGYSTFGIEFITGDTLNLTSPSELYHRDQTTIEVRPSDDLEGSQLTRSSYHDKRLKNLIYFEDLLHDEAVRHYFAVLDSGSYLSSYTSFNYTEFALAAFRDWSPGALSKLHWGPLDLQSKAFYNAWDHNRLDPFKLYR